MQSTEWSQFSFYRIDIYRYFAISSIVPVSGGIINNTRQVNYDAKFSIKTLNSSGAEVHYLNSPYNESIQNQNNSITIGFFPPDFRKTASIPLSAQFIPECIQL
jgi:hypothetical protein